jgi:hypothetical protein
MVETVHPRRAGPRFVSFAGKGMLSRLSACAIAARLWPRE